MRFGALSAWTVSGGDEATTTLILTTPSSAFLTGTRASRDGRYGPTLGGHYIAIPEADGASVGDHYFYFTQGDEDGVQRGIDPFGWDSGSLSGYTGHQVEIPFGNISNDIVATALRNVMTGVYTTVSVSGSQVAVTASVDVTGTFFGSNWDSRGPAGIWGMQNEDGFSNDFDQGDTVFAHLLTPNVSGTIFVRAMSIYVGGTYTGTNRLRLACYQSGTSTNDPTGATLLYDFGQIPTGSTDRWYTLFTTGTVTLTSGSDTWIGCISDGSSNTSVAYEGADADYGDFTIGQNIITCNTSIGTSPGSPAPSTIGAGSVESGFSFVLACRLHYEVDPIVGNGEWKRRYGVHVDAAVVPTFTTFSGTQMCGGNFPIQVSGSSIDYVDILGSNTPTYRVSILQGGVIEDPDGGTVAWDAGQLSGGAGVDFYRVTAPTGSSSISVDLGEPIWIWLKGDGSNGRIHVDTGTPNQVNPSDNPMDWPVNAGVGSRQEYVTTEDNANHTLDASVAFETPFVSDASDSLPGNNPPYSFGVRVDGFTASGSTS